MSLTNSMLQPCEDKILVLPDEREQVTKGGIHLPDVSTEKPCRGTVIAVGPGKMNELSGLVLPMPVSVNQKVYFQKWGGNTIKLPDQPELLVLRPEHLLCIVSQNGTTGDE